MKLTSIFWRIRNYLKFRMAGVKIPNGIKGFNVKNKFYLNVEKGGIVKIGNHFTFYSGDCLNPLSRNLYGCISVDKNAILSIGDNVDISASTIRCRKKLQLEIELRLGLMLYCWILMDTLLIIQKGER